MNARYPVLLAALSLIWLPGCSHHQEGHHEEPHKVVVTSPVLQDVVISQQYVCQIHSSRHIAICALQDGYLEEIPVKEGQAVKKGDVMFKLLPTLYQAKFDAEAAEAQLAQIEYDNTERLHQKNVVSSSEVALAKAKLNKAQAKANLAKAELNFATIKAPFDGIIDHQIRQHGSLIAEGDELTTLSDNSTMWVYFNVPEARYLEYMASKDNDSLKIELVLANGKTFPQVGKIGAIEADFNNETGNIAFRADFSNPGGLLRHGQTGTIHISRLVKNALVIPQRATYEILAKKYVYLVGDQSAQHEEGVADPAGHHATKVALHDTKEEGKEHAAHGEHGAEHEPKGDEKLGVAHQREIEILAELDDIYLIKAGVDVADKIVLEGVRQARDGQSLKYEFMSPEKALSNLKHHAE